MRQSQLLRDVLPDYYAQVLAAMRAKGHPELAAQLPYLIIGELCPCTDEDGGASFTCGPKLCTGRRNVTTLDLGGNDADFDGVLIDLASDGRIIGFEIVDRPHLRTALQSWAAKR